MEIIFGGGWYDCEVLGGDVPTYWMGDAAEIHAHSDRASEVKLTFTAMSYADTRILSIIYNGEMVFSDVIPPKFIKTSVYFNLRAGSNVVKLRADSSCRPKDRDDLHNSDSRNLSIAFQNITISRIDDNIFDYQMYPYRINLGCGFDKRPDYLNVDLQKFHEPDLVCDVRELCMLPSGTYREIVAHDVLEHLPQIDIIPTLQEWYRLLRIGGVLKLRVPDMTRLLNLLNSGRDQEEIIKCIYGSQAYLGDYHLSGFTESVLINYLEIIGYKNITANIKDDWLLVVMAKK